MMIQSRLGYYIRLRREECGWSRRKLAHLLGFTDIKAGAAAIRLLEELGQVDPPNLLERAVSLLALDQKELCRLHSLDRQAAGDWLRKVCRPVGPYFGIKLGPMANQVNVPNELLCDPQAVEEYVSRFARSHRLPVRLHLNRRVCLAFDRSGDLIDIQEMGRNGFFFLSG